MNIRTLAVPAFILMSGSLLAACGDGANDDLSPAPGAPAEDTMEDPTLDEGTMEEPLEDEGTMEEPLEDEGTLEEPLEDEGTLEEPVE
jgi:hypothetical protein